MRTSLQIHSDVKSELNKLKDYPRESYEDVIKRLVLEKKVRERKKEELLKQGYSEMFSDSEKIIKEWSVTERDFGDES